MTQKPSRDKRKRIISRLPYSLLIIIMFGFRFLSFLPKKATDILLGVPFHLLKMLGRLRARNVYIKLFHFLPLKVRWRYTQKRYEKWSKNRLPGSYLHQIRETGKNFSVFVGKPQLCLDIGCGNGIFGGMTYEEAGYIYLNPSDTDTVIGIDPLPLEGPKPPGFDEYMMAIGEKLPFKCIFDKITLATSLDHLLDPTICLKECTSVLKNSLYIWTTCLTRTKSDLHHPIRFTKQDLLSMLANSGYSITNCQILNQTKYSEEVFIAATRNRA